jgi:hypothetical protein
MHMLSWLAVNGTAAIVEFPGVLYRGGAERKIRQYLVDNNFIDAVIQLPPDLFFGTTIGTCIIVLKKSKADNKILFIDAAAEFVRQGNKNRLTPDNRARILEAYVQRHDIEYFARLVTASDVAANDYNIAVSSYVTQEDTREATDIVALNAEIARIVARQSQLRTEIDAIVADIENDVSTSQADIVYSKVEAACSSLIQSDAALLEVDANERSITHKLAEHLQREFPDWEVDCEYNRDRTIPKRLISLVSSVQTDDTEGKTVFPDIIVHKRGTDNNLLVIEAKKSSTRSHGNDLEKLRAYKSDLDYKFAFAVVFPVKGEDHHSEFKVEIREI